MNKLTRYPWKRWLTRYTDLKLVQGVDYHCQPHAMAQQCRNAAAKMGISLSIHIDGRILIVRNRGRAT